MWSRRILGRHGPKPAGIQASTLQGIHKPRVDVFKREPGGAQGFKKVHHKPFLSGLFGETHPAKSNGVVAQQEVAGPFSVVYQRPGPHGRGAEAKTVPGGGASKNERCAFQEGSKNSLKLGRNISESARPGDGEQPVRQLLEPPFLDEPLRKPDGVGRPCGQSLGAQHLTRSQFGGRSSRHRINSPVKTIRSGEQFRKRHKAGSALKVAQVEAFEWANLCAAP